MFTQHHQIIIKKAAKKYSAIISCLEYKQPCLRPFLSNRKALCSYQATQRKYNHFFCFQLCFSSQKQSISYLFLLYTSQRGIITVILLLFCHFLSHKK